MKPFIFSIFMIFTIGFIYIGIPWLHGRFLRILLSRKSADKKVLVLTFDDGPGDRMTPMILTLLSEYHAKATFFLLGRNVANREHLVRQIASEGHEICSHGYDHLNYWKYSPWRCLADIQKGWKAIDKALGTQHVKYPFRPPYGKLNIICLIYLLIRRVPVLYWSLDSGDTWSPVGHRDSHRTAQLAKKSGGAVTLAHDFDRSDDRSERFVLESLQYTLEMAKNHNKKFMTISEFSD